MMRDISRLEVWFEPRVGELFDPYHMRFEQRGGKHFVFSEHHSETWMKNVRDLIFDSAQVRFPKTDAYDHLMVKEPSGSVGARMLMRAVPESRMILLVRDPRDVAASWIDAMKEGGWSHDRSLAKGGRSEPPATSARKRANVYFKNVSESKRAYDEHPGLKTLVRYEDLRADTSATMKRMFSEVGVKIDEAELDRVVDAHSWERIPEDQKGEGKFYRKATSEGWREDLDEEQIRHVEEQTGGLMDELGYERHLVK